MNRTDASDASDRSVSVHRRLPRHLHTGDSFVIVLGTVLMFIVGFMVGGMSLSSILSMLPFASILAVAAIGQTLVVQQRGMDFSVAGTFSLSAVIVTVYPTQSPGGLFAALVIIAVSAVVTGLVNGLAVIKFRITPLVATLGVNAVLLGVTRTYSGGTPARAPQALTDFVTLRIFGVPMTALIAFVVVAAAALVLQKSVFGRRLTLVGSSPSTAATVGIEVARYQVGAYVFASLSYAAAAVLFAGYVNTPTIDSGNSYLLATVTAVVLGGTALTGGRASLVATSVGALFITGLNQLVLALGAPPSVQLLVQAIAIALAVLLRVVYTDLRVPNLWTRAFAFRKDQPLASIR